MSSIALGWVRIRRSLLPRTSRWKSLKRSPRKAASSSARAWIMVPMAPSSTRMRSRAAAISAVRLGETDTDIRRPSLSSFLGAVRTDAEQVADREHEIGAVHGVEMEGVDAMLGELLHLAGRDGGGDQLPCLAVVVEAFEFFRKPARHGSTGAGDEIAGLLEIVHRHDAGHDRNGDAAPAHAVEVAEVKVVIEEDLRDRARRAGVDLGLQRVDVGVEVTRLRVLLG